MKIALVGCNGLLGQSLLRESSRRPDLEIAGFGMEETALLPELCTSYQKVDIGKQDHLQESLKACEADWILNAAALTNVDACEEQQELCRRINCEAVAWMAELGRPMVQISTDYVFDGIAGPYTEEDQVNPISFYGLTKLQSEREVLGRNPNSLILRTMLLWGKGRGLKQSFTDFVKEALEAKKELKIVTDQIGDPTLASDLARAIFDLIQMGCKGLYHASGSERMSRLDWAQAVADYFKLDSSKISTCLTSDLNQKAARPLRSGFINAKLEKQLGWSFSGLKSQLQSHFSSNQNLESR